MTRPTYPNAVTIAAHLVHERLRMEIPLTIEACEDALNAVYRLWESRGMFGCHCDDDAIPTLHVSDSARVIYIDGSKR